jgi:hypothetical protein
MSPGDVVNVVGQSAGDTGITWWKLDSGGWVRSDVVEESTLCDSVPQASS